MFPSPVEIILPRAMMDTSETLDIGDISVSSTELLIFILDRPLKG
jgi:hypothetical protein